MELVNELTAAEPAIAAGEVPDAVLAGILRDSDPVARALRALSRRRALGEDRRHGASASPPWPNFDEALAREEEIEIPVQVNGKLRAVIRVAAGRGEEALAATQRWPTESAGRDRRQADRQGGGCARQADQHRGEVGGWRSTGRGNAVFVHVLRRVLVAPAPARARNSSGAGSSACRSSRCSVRRASTSTRPLQTSSLPPASTSSRSCDPMQRRCRSRPLFTPSSRRPFFAPRSGLGRSRSSHGPSSPGIGRNAVLRRFDPIAAAAAHHADHAATAAHCFFSVGSFAWSGSRPSTGPRTTTLSGDEPNLVALLCAGSSACRWESSPSGRW